MLHGPRRILVIAVSLIALPITMPMATAVATSVGSSAGSSATVAVVRPSVEQPPLAKRGDRSPTVRKLQQLLVKAGIFVRGGVDGIFGSGTEAAVKDYQTHRGLTANGTLDIPTATVLGMVTAPPILARGARGEAVRIVQQQLITVGLTLFGGADGVYGSATVATLKVFQKSKSLIATGAVDAGTAAILANAAAAVSPPTTTEPPPPAPPTTPAPPAPPPATPPPAPPPATPPAGDVLSLGSRGEAVKTMQRQLIAVGIVVFGGADGVFGPATQTALKQFQTQAGLPASGVLDEATKAALVAAAPVPTPPPVAPPTPPPVAPPTPPPAGPPATPPAGPIVLAAFPVTATCSFTDTYGAPRSGGRKHQGVDILMASGSPIFAVLDGRISKKQIAYAGSLGGNSLWLSATDGTYFFYAHLSAFADGIEVGSVVTAGTLIGYVGATGNASVSHLHFEIHLSGGAAVNPYPIVRAANSCK